MLAPTDKDELMGLALARAVPANCAVQLGKWEIRRSRDGGEISVFDSGRVALQTLRVGPVIFKAAAPRVPRGPFVTMYGVRGADKNLITAFPNYEFDPSWMTGALVPQLLKVRPCQPVGYVPAVDKMLEHVDLMSRELFGELLRLDAEIDLIVQHQQEGVLVQQRDQSAEGPEQMQVKLRRLIDAAPWSDDIDLGIVPKGTPAWEPSPARPRAERGGC